MASGSYNCLRQDNFTLENVCRLCIFSNLPMRNIFKTHIASGDEVYKVLNYLFDLGITVNDPLPPNICQSCLCKVTAYFAFKRNALRAKSELIQIVDALRTVVPKEETVNEELDPEAITKEKQLENDVVELNVGRADEDAEPESSRLVECKEVEVVNEGIHFNALEAKLAIKEEIEIAERNAPNDLIIEHDYGSEPELLESHNLSTAEDQPTEDGIEENGSHGKEVFSGKNKRRNIKKNQQTTSDPLPMSSSNSSMGLQKLRRNPHNRKRKQNAEVASNTKLALGRNRKEECRQQNKYDCED